MSFAKDNGLDVYRLVANVTDKTYSVQNGEKTLLTLVPLETLATSL